MGNLLEASLKVVKDKIYAQVRAILEAPNPKAARLLVLQTLAVYDNKSVKAMRILGIGFYDVTAVLSLLKITEERLNEEVPPFGTTRYSHFFQPGIRNSIHRCATHGTIRNMCFRQEALRYVDIWSGVKVN